MCKHDTQFYECSLVLTITFLPLFSPAREVLTEDPAHLPIDRLAPWPPLTSASTHPQQVSLGLRRASSVQSPALSVGGDPVQLFKLDGGETRGPEGPAFVLRHRTLNVAEQRTAESAAAADPMSPQSKCDTPTSGPSTSHLSASGCTSHNGVSTQHTQLVGCDQCGSTGHPELPPHQNTRCGVNNWPVEKCSVPQLSQLHQQRLSEAQTKSSTSLRWRALKSFNNKMFTDIYTWIIVGLFFTKPPVSVLKKTSSLILRNENGSLQTCATRDLPSCFVFPPLSPCSKNTRKW